MARGTGECPIYKRKRKYADGTEYFIYAFDMVLPDGTKKPFYSKKGERKGEFQKRKNEIMLQYQKQINIGYSGILMKDFLHNWLATKRDISPSTRRVYRDYLESYIKPFIGSTSLQKITQDNIDTLIAQLQKTGGKSLKDDGTYKQLKPLAPSSLRKVKFMLKQAFDYAIDREYIAKNPAQKITLPPTQKAIIKPLTTDHMKQILDIAKGTPMYMAILLDLSTGLRRGELLALQWSDIDLDCGFINIHRQLLPSVKKNTGYSTYIVDSLKTHNSTRQVGIPLKVIEELRIHQAQQELDKQELGEAYQDKDINFNLVIRQSNGKHYHPRDFAKKFDKILKDAGVEKRKIHDMRHTYATHLLTNGAYVNEVQMSLGHSDPKTTLQNYAHILPGRQKEIANRMNDILPL